MSASAIEFQDVQKSFGLEFSLGLPLRQENARTGATLLMRWFALLQRIFWPAYVALMTASSTGAFQVLWWFRWGLIAAAAALCLSGYFILVFQLRAGIKPSSNESLFSAG